MISLSCISVNLAIQYFTGRALRDYWKRENGYSDLTVFMLIVMIEHIIILFKVLISSLIADEPGWVQEAEIE